MASGEDQAADRPGRETSPPVAAERAEEARLVQAAVAALPAEHRVVVELRFFAGASLDEIATLVGCPLGTVKSRLHADTDAEFDEALRRHYGSAIFGASGPTSRARDLMKEFLE